MSAKPWLAAIVCVLLLAIPYPGFSYDQDEDLLASASAAIPEGWTAALSARLGSTYLSITTAEMDTAASIVGQGGSGIEKTPLVVKIEILPRYSNAMLLRVREHNRPIERELKELDYYSEAYQDLSHTLIPEPMFMDARYGYRVKHMSRVPAHESDKRLLLQALRKLTQDWISIDVNQTPIDQIRPIVTE